MGPHHPPFLDFPLGPFSLRLAAPIIVVPLAAPPSNSRSRSSPLGLAACGAGQVGSFPAGPEGPAFPTPQAPVPGRLLSPSLACSAPDAGGSAQKCLCSALAAARPDSLRLNCRLIRQAGRMKRRPAAHSEDSQGSHLWPGPRLLSSLLPTPSPAPNCRLHREASHSLPGREEEFGFTRPWGAFPQPTATWQGLTFWLPRDPGISAAHSQSKVK